MKLPHLPTYLGICAGLLAALPLQAGCFAAPTEGALAFRRDRLPLDAERMLDLSANLCSLAQAQGGENPPQRRSAAQMLALALALQPGNPDARRLVETFTKNELKPAGDAKQIDAARNQLWQVLAWLETPAAGADANALAACLGDVMASAEPQHPHAEALRKLGEQGAWGGWVEPLEAFRKAEATKETPSGPAQGRLPAQPTAAASPILLAAAMVTTPLWSTDKATGATAMRALPVHMSAKWKDGNARAEPLSCALDAPQAPVTPESSPFKLTSATMVAALAKDHGPLPTGVAVGLVCGDNVDYLIERNHSAISAAAAVLMSAAITGCEPSATVIGEVQADGSLKLPPFFWDKLRCLADGPGGRLILPMEAAKYLPAMLALEQTSFFFHYEILLAANLHELIERSAKKPSPELAKLSANFLEVRSKLGNQRPTEYLANRFVRLRLDEIVHEASYHASARMLALQGSGDRPASLTRNILANELRRLIRPMAWIASCQVDKLSNKSLSDTCDVCLRDVEHLERYAEIRDHELYTQVHDLVIALRTLTRATHDRSINPKTHAVPWRAEFTAFSRSYQAVGESLHRAAADG
ncbi:MAG: hypothetical protein DVB25_02710 [Verrucomicrobia bacterium]|nr:MAG: hypothetical protein DVB25_02710 [Verrucomicrobiota bacterium]